MKLLNTAGAEVEEVFGKSRFRQLLELGLLGLRGYSAADYYVLDLYRDPRQASRYMNRRQFDTVRRRWNLPVQGIIEFNKWIFGNYCSNVGIPVPRCYGLFHHRTGITREGKALRDLNHLRKLMSDIASPLVFKPIAGSHGDHVLVIDSYEAETDVVRRANGQEMPLQDLHQSLLRQDFPWLIQAKVREHPTLRVLHATSLSTSRVITLLNHEGTVHVLGAVLRIGVGNAEIDNTTGGGIAARIDLETGCCGAAIAETTIRRITHHPDSGQPIEGLVVPFWEDMKATAIRAHRLLPFASSLGWDIAFSEDGPEVLEVNGTWFYNHIQMTGTSLWDTAFGKGPGGSLS